MFSGHPLDDEKMIFQNKPFLRPGTPHGPASMAPPDVSTPRKETDPHRWVSTLKKKHIEK